VPGTCHRRADRAQRPAEAGSSRRKQQEAGRAGPTTGTEVPNRPARSVLAASRPAADHDPLQPQQRPSQYECECVPLTPPLVLQSISLDESAAGRDAASHQRPSPHRSKMHAFVAAGVAPQFARSVPAGLALPVQRGSGSARFLLPLLNASCFCWPLGRANRIGRPLCLSARRTRTRETRRSECGAVFVSAVGDRSAFAAGRARVGNGKPGEPRTPTDRRLGGEQPP